jgi:adhesin transport system outer membrane protein
MINKTIYTVTFASFLSFVTLLQATTLKETVVVTLETHPSISAQEAASKATEFQIDAAMAGYFPTLDVFGSVGRQYTRIVERLDPPLSFPLQGHATRNVANPVISFRQNIFDGMATPFAVEQAKALNQQALSTLGLTREQIAFQAVTAHANVYAQQALLEIYEDSIKKHEEILRQVKKRVEGGISTIADVDQVLSRLEQAKVIKERTEGELEAAIANYVSIADFHPQKLQTPNFPRDLYEESLDSILARVYNNNPNVLVSRTQLEVAEAQLDQTLTPFLPTIRVELNANDPILNPGGVKGRNGVYTAQVVGQYNLYSGGKDLANRQAQIEKVVQAKKLLDASWRNAKNQASSAYAKLLSSDQQVNELDVSVDVNRKLIREYELQFQLVSLPIPFLLDAYVSYYQSKADLINQEAQEVVNYALVLASMGELVAYFEKKSLKMQKECTPSEAS